MALNLILVIDFVIASVYKLYGLSNFHDDFFITTIGSVAFLLGSIRFPWAYLSDKFSFKLTYFIVLSLQIITSLTLKLISHNKALYFIWICTIIVCEGAQFVLVPTICAKLFGNYSAVVYSFMFSFVGFSSILASILVRFELKSKGYEFFFYLGGSMSAVALFILILFFKEVKVC